MALRQAGQAARGQHIGFGTVLATVFRPWDARLVVARPPSRVGYFAAVGLLWLPGFGAGESLGHALHERFVWSAPQANLMGTVAPGMVSRPLSTSQILLLAAAWLVGSAAFGAVLVGLGGAVLGALLRDRPLGRGVGAVASLFAPMFALAAGIVLMGDVLLVDGRRDWLATALVAMLVLWPIAGWAILAATAARDAAHPRLPPVWCAAAFVVANVVVLRSASEAAALPLALVHWLTQV